MAKIDSLRRSTATRPMKRTIYVLTEGDKTEPGYISALKNVDDVRRNNEFTIALGNEHSVPFSLVEEAMRVAKDPEIDTVWCISDIEAPQQHPNISRAIALAEKNPKVNLVFTNPCFELWLLLHDRDVTRYKSTDDMEREVQSLPSVSGKVITDGKYFMERREAAIRRAKDLRLRHQRNDSHRPHDNPSSDMDLFMAYVLQLPGGS